MLDLVTKYVVRHHYNLNLEYVTNDTRFKTGLCEQRKQRKEIYLLLDLT